MDYKALLFVARFCYARARGSTGLLYIVATIMTLPKPKMMMRLRKERKLSYIRVNTASEFLAGNGDFCLTGTVPHARHYNPRLVFFYLIFTAVYIVERLVLQTIYVLNKEILHFLGLKSVVYNQERFQIKNRL